MADDNATPVAPPDLQPDVPAPSPQDAGVQPAPAPDVQSAPAMPQGPAPAAPATPGSKWANVIKGALTGLAVGGIPGFAAGAVAPNTVQRNVKQAQAAKATEGQQAQANVRFTDAQSANMQSETAMRQIQAEQLPKTLQLAIQKNEEEQVRDLMNRGAQPVFTTDGADPKALQAALQNVHDANGAVPSIVTFHVGDKLVGFDLGQLGQGTAVKSQVDKMRAVQGMPPLDNSQWNNGKLITPAIKGKMIADSAHFFNPVPESGDKLNGQVQQYKNYLANATALPDETPDKANMVKQLTTAVGVLQSSAQSREAEKTRTGVTIANARGAAFNNSKIIPVLGDDGTLKLGRAGAAADAGLAPGVEGVKVMGKQSQLQDIKVGLDSVRTDVGKLDTPFSTAQVAQLNLAINSPDHSVIAASIKALNAQNLTPAQKQFVVDVAQLHERALSLRSIAGMGQGSDMMRQAIVQMLPGASSGDREMMTKQLDAMDQQVNVLGSGIPKVNADTSKGAKQAPKYSVGDTVNYQGKPHKITGIDKAGKLQLAP